MLAVITLVNYANAWKFLRRVILLPLRDFAWRLKQRLELSRDKKFFKIFMGSASVLKEDRLTHLMPDKQLAWLRFGSPDILRDHQLLK